MYMAMTSGATLNLQSGALYLVLGKLRGFELSALPSVWVRGFHLTGFPEPYILLLHARQRSHTNETVAPVKSGTFRFDKKQKI